MAPVVKDPTCGWPFSCKAGCKSCAEWETLYGKNIDDWLEAKAEARAAAKRKPRPV